MFEDYVTIDGDTVDLIAYRRFGAHGNEWRIYDTNPGLAAIGPILPLGTPIRIPVPEIKDRAQSDRLWS